MSELRTKGKVKPKTPISFPTEEQTIEVACPCCSARAQAKVLTVSVHNVAGMGRAQYAPTPGVEANPGILATAEQQTQMSFTWLVMPDGWAHALPLTWFETRGLKSGLARCPLHVPRPNTIG